MIDWSSTMQQTFEYYIVDPGTWKDERKIENVVSSSIKWDLTTETLGSATIDIDEPLGEAYIRIYMAVIQNGVKETYPLGTFLIQTPSSKFDGKIKKMTMDAYTPLLELKEKYPPLGYSILKKENIMQWVYRLACEHARAPVYEPKNDKTLEVNFIANTDDTWLTFLTSLMANANYRFGLDELGGIIFMPDQDTRSLRPVWTYTDDNSSILYPDLDMERDLYGIPNVVEVIYANGSGYYYGEAVNNDSSSPVSTVNRGRRIVHRVTNPEVLGNPSKEEIQELAKRILREKSTLEYTVTYTHGYCPVRPGDCIRLNYKRAGLNGIKAKVISQTIDCTPGCPVTEKAIFTTQLWG